MTLNIDRNIFSDSCISTVIYWFSNQYTIQRTLQESIETLTIDNVSDEKQFRLEFFQKLNDYKLREQIDKETKDIKTILYAKAFGEFDELTEEEILE
ncbi:MAG: His-Xaa-Ser system protein HxsD [Prevotella sp.]|jgi:His-Xaa-Ser system protein HxsD|uniref:His-Xaa-Ser system protein HxsD n=1 Tax=Prevotella sp. TaxID=59823 RepID=UPI002A31FD1D|nr:His-Xaa-Ser system protein HxsD [Prevotella sp.]MDD7318798.1 His-Xaa-Ser system protein HxsD [Prevotellaceae bacterium]MDY4019574.1 His-Xaa-Ser system protein HxsD [Prevotella sp.]